MGNLRKNPTSGRLLKHPTSGRLIKDCPRTGNPTIYKLTPCVLGGAGGSCEFCASGTTPHYLYVVASVPYCTDCLAVGPHSIKFSGTFVWSGVLTNQGPTLKCRWTTGAEDAITYDAYTGVVDCSNAPVGSTADATITIDKISDTEWRGAIFSVTLAARSLFEGTAIVPAEDCVSIFTINNSLTCDPDYGVGGTMVVTPGANPDGVVCPGSATEPVYTLSDLSAVVGKAIFWEGVCWSVSIAGTESVEPVSGYAIHDNCVDCCGAH